MRLRVDRKASERVPSRSPTPARPRAATTRHPIHAQIEKRVTPRRIVAALVEDATGQVVLYFSSDRPGGMGNVDIYSSLVNEDGEFEWAALVTELSTSFIDERPNIRKDGLELFFDSNCPGSLGATDLWVSTRQSTADPWSPPVNLGSAVNTASAWSCVRVRAVPGSATS